MNPSDTTQGYWQNPTRHVHMGQDYRLPSGDLIIPSTEPSARTWSLAFLAAYVVDPTNQAFPNEIKEFQNAVGLPLTGVVDDAVKAVAAYYAALTPNPTVAGFFGVDVSSALGGSARAAPGAFSSPPGAMQTPGLGQGTPFALHLGRGALPAHESGLDCRIRVFAEGNTVCGVARCDTSYGPVVLTAKADKRVVGSLAVAARAVRQHLLRQAVELPTESRSKYVAHAAALRDKMAAKDPTAISKIASVKALAQKGDKKASAFLAMVVSADATSGAPAFGAASMPAYHRAAIAVPGPSRTLSAVEHARIASALAGAVARIPAFRKTSAARL